MIGSDDVLACFIAGNVFTWDDWFRLETEDDSLQPTIDMLLNVAIFMWFGAVCPWHLLAHNNIIPLYRLIPLGILVLLLRRLPMILAFQKGIHQVEDFRRALFLGYFGPIGVSAIFYLYISKEFLREIEYNGHEREDAARLSEMMDVIVWFLVACSIVGHGLSIPLGKLGFYLPRTISTALSSDRLSWAQSTARDTDQEDRDENNTSTDFASVFRRRRPADYGTATPQSASNNSNGNIAGSQGDRPRPQISAPSNPRAIGRVVTAASADAVQLSPDGPAGSSERFQRSIRFGDEEPKPSV
jgi:hypothetical protein